MDNVGGIRRVLWIALAGNLAVAIGKVTAGLATGVLSILADGIHSFTDAGSSVLGLIAVRTSRQPSDERHHYGHQKYETVAALGIGFLVALAGWEIIKQAFSRFTGDVQAVHTPVTWLILGLGMVVNTGIALYERSRGHKYQSELLLADAVHTASDILVSLTVIVSLAAIWAGYHWVDPAVSVMISLYLFYVAFRLVKENILDLTDAAYLDPQEVKAAAMSVPGVVDCHRIRTRGRPGRAFVDLHVQVHPDTDTRNAHRIVHDIENRLRDRLSGISDVLIHTEPHL